MKILDCINLSKSYGEREILSNINFSLYENDFISIVGKSGSGKSTLLHILGNILQQTSGKIQYNNIQPVMVFQHYNKSIYPWLTVSQNLQLVLNEENKATKEKINYYLSLVGLKEVKDYLPHELSGGMLQRVAIARSLVLESKLLLLDEPFGSLDSNIKVGLEVDLLRLCDELKLTVILVSHDIEEAIFLSKKVFFLDDKTHTFSKKFVIDLPYPRKHMTTKITKEFLLLKKDILQCFI